MAAELGEHLTDEEVDKIFQKTDYDQDGYITAEDFYNVIAQREGVYDWCPTVAFEIWTNLLVGDRYIDFWVWSAGPEPKLGGRREAGIELIVEVSNPFIIVLVFHLVPGVSWVSPPPVEQERKEEGNGCSGIEMVSMHVKLAVSLERSCWPP